MKRILKLLGSLLGLLALAALMIALTTTFRNLRGESQPASSLFQSPIETPTQPPYPVPQTPTSQVPITPYPSPAPSPTPTPTPTPIVLDNGWYLYTDPDGEFSFAYPPTTLISSGQNPVDSSKNIILQFNLPDKPYQGMSIRLESNPKRLQGVEIAIKLFEDSSQKPVPAEFTNSLEQISVGGKPGVQAHIPSTNTEIIVIVPYDDKVIILAPVHDTTATKVEKEILEVFYQILDTFKFGASK